MFVCSDQRESHIVTKKFEVRQLETNDDENVDFNHSVVVTEVRWTIGFIAAMQCLYDLVNVVM